MTNPSALFYLIKKIFKSGPEGWTHGFCAFIQIKKVQAGYESCYDAFMLQNILIINSSRQEVELLRAGFESKGFNVTAAYSANEALKRFDAGVFHYLVIDEKFVAQKGQKLNDFLLDEAKSIPGSVLVRENPPPKTLAATLRRLGFSCVYRPLKIPQIVGQVVETLAPYSVRELGQSEGAPGAAPQEKTLLGNSAPMHELLETLAAVARTDATVLLKGETGTGKELAARFLHANGSRSREPFIAVNCAALTETLLESELFGHEKGAFTGAYQQKIGKFEYAGRGTLFLDEIGEIAPRLQAKMLRILERRDFERVGGNRTLPVQCRIIAASNIDFPKALRESRFREDLYYRLNVLAIDLPPLRDRKEDISLLAGDFLRRFTLQYQKAVTGISTEILDQLLEYPWPGNVRELENAIERAVILSKGSKIERLPLPKSGIEVSRTSLNPSLPDPMGKTLRAYRDQVLFQCERDYLVQLLKANRGHISKTAQAAGIDRKTFYRKIERYRIEPKQFKRRSRTYSQGS